VQAVSRRSPHRPPRVYSVRQRFSAPAHGTRRGQIECGGSAGLSSTFQRHGTQHLLHYWSPSSFHLVPVCRQLQRAYYLDFARARAPRSVPSGFVQRTGCSACGLGYPHQVLVGSPHVHSSLLVPVSLSGFLIKCLRVHWQSLPQCRFAWLFLAPCGLLLPKKYKKNGFSSRVGFSSRFFSPCHLV